MNLYVDCNATTPIVPEAQSAMAPFLNECFGNASSTFHEMGARAAEALTQARAQLAELLDANPSEVICTSGGTESCLHAFLGVLRARLKAGSSLSTCLISSVEHPAVLESASLLHELHGVDTVLIPVIAGGAFDFDSFERLLAAHERPLVSVMYANNETGIVFPLREIVARAKQVGSVVHCDATQAIGKTRLSFRELGVDLLSLSAHKFGGPKGVGALVLADSCTEWTPVMPGGGQEAGRRGGTEAVANIVAMGAAAKKKQEHIERGSLVDLANVRDRFEELVLAGVPGAEVNGAGLERLPNTSSVFIPGVNANGIKNDLAKKGIVLSTGSACSSSHASASPVLQAMGRSPAECLSVFRVSFSFEHTLADAEHVARELLQSAQSDRAQREAALTTLLSE